MYINDKYCVLSGPCIKSQDYDQVTEIMTGMEDTYLASDSCNGLVPAKHQKRNKLQCMPYKLFHEPMF